MFEFEKIIENSEFKLSEQQNGKEELSKNDILPFILKILNKRFPNEIDRHFIKDYSNRISFNCPYCGDSDKNKNKTRGNVYFENLGFKCFNCGQVRDLKGLVSDFLGDDAIQKLSRFKFETGFFKNNGKNLQYIFDLQGAEKYLFTKEEIFEKYNLTDINNSKEILLFLNKRNVFDKYELFAYSKSENCLYIFNMDSTKKYVLSFIKRRMYESKKYPKYIIYKLDKIYQDFKRNFDKELLEELNHISIFYNLFEVDFSKTVTITEGFFDSMFIPNSIAQNGAKRILPFDISAHTIRFCLDNDKTGQRYQTEYLKNGHSVFLWKKLIKDIENKYKIYNINIKDTNELFVFCKQNNILNFLHENYNSYFSNNKYDLWWI